MKRWQSELDYLNIPWEIRDGIIYLWKCGKEFPYTEHEIYKLIRQYKKHRGTKNVKRFTHRINRRRTKDAIRNEEEIPAGMVYEENPWNYS